MQDLFMSSLDIPDVTGSIEPSADWAARSFGSAFDDTLWGWAPILGHGYALIWGQRTNLLSHSSACFLLLLSQ